MESNTYKKGERVVNPAKPEWGVGEVLEMTSDTAARIFFVLEGDRTISLTHAKLDRVTGPKAKHPLLDELRLPELAISSNKIFRSLPACIKLFETAYPNGFYGDLFTKQERNYKVAAHEAAVATLAPATIKKLVADGQHEEVCKRATRLLSKTNLVNSHEIMALADGLKTAEGKKIFATALATLLDEGLPLKDRFETFAHALEELEAAKWTLASYFLFLSVPSKYMFVKPTVTKYAAEITRSNINYDSQLNWLTYQSVLAFSSHLMKGIASLKPRDMIDVQSFMWCIAPI